MDPIRPRGPQGHHDTKPSGPRRPHTQPARIPLEARASSWGIFAPAKKGDGGTVTHLFRQMEHAISAGILVPHQALPARENLSPLVELSERCVADVMSFLEMKGLIYRRRVNTRGFYVVDMGTRALPKDSVTNGGDIHLSIISGTNVALSGFEQIKAAIRDGHLPGGKDIPNPKELSLRFSGYQEAELVETYLCLERDGLIKQTAGHFQVTTLQERMAHAMRLQQSMVTRFRANGLDKGDLRQIFEDQIKRVQIDPTSDQEVPQPQEPTAASIFKMDRKRSDRPAAEVLYEQIRNAIRDGRLHSRFVLPSLDRMARENSISQNSIRLAYERLLNEGWIRRRDKSEAMTRWWVPSPDQARRDRLKDTSCYRAKPGHGNASRTFLANIKRGIQKGKIIAGSTLRSTNEAARLAKIQKTVAKRCYTQLVTEGIVQIIERPDPRAEFEVVEFEESLSARGASAHRSGEALPTPIRSARACYQLPAKTNDPIYQVLYGQVRNAIAMGMLHPGALLESSKTVGRYNNISFQLVLQAYRRLEIDGLISRTIFNGHYAWAVNGKKERIECAAVYQRRLQNRLVQLGLDAACLRSIYEQTLT